MKIKSIDINAFGGVKDLHINASDGLNVIYGENGSGKSTVSDFIKSVFYGIGRGKDRTRRIPWDGSKASGSISYSTDKGEFLCQAAFGRTARGDKCEVINDISGEICGNDHPGPELFSMSDITFSKTAFISSNGAEIEQKGDDEIAEKLSNLKETGDESVSFSAAASDVDAYMARLIAKRGRGGRIQQLEDGIEELKSELYNAQKNSEEGYDIKKALDDAKYRRSLLERDIKFLKTASEIADFRYIRSIKEQLCSIPEAENTVGAQEFLNQISKLSHELSSIDARIEELPKTGDEGISISQSDFAEVTEAYYSQGAKPKISQFILKLGLSAAFTVLGFVNPFFFIGTAVFLVLSFLCRPKKQKHDLLSQSLIKFGEQDYEAFRERYMEQEKQKALKKSNDEIRQKLCAEGERITKELENQKQLANQTFGDWKNLESIIKNAADINEKRQSLSSALNAALRGRNYDEMYEKYGDDSVEIPENHAEKLKIAERALSENSSTIINLERRSGVLEGSGCDLCELERRIGELSQRKDKLQFDYEVLSTVLEVLNESYEVMEGEFGEKLNRTAGEILEGITGYNTARMSRDFGIILSENGEIHDISDFSTGLFEQVYLSFRLAMLKAMEGDCPVFLDDCLMTYDDIRAQKLVSYLAELSKERQVFLFTCRSRDVDIASRLGARCITI